VNAPILLQTSDQRKENVARRGRPLQPTDEQVESRAEELVEEPGNRTDDPEAQARALLEESEERIEDPAVSDPDDDSVIRRASDEGVTRRSGD
jgi:hypothetical protein